MATTTSSVAAEGEPRPTDDDSSDSDGDEPARAFCRRVSTSREIKTTASTKEGYLAKQIGSFQRWKKRFFKLKGRKLYYAKEPKSVLFDEIELVDVSVAECGTKNAKHSFQIITPFRVLVLCADHRRDMEEWIAAVKSAAHRAFYEGLEHRDFLSGQHSWYVASHARPTYCNVCREALSGVMSHGLSCEVCKLKTHKKCAAKAVANCKWTTLASVGKDILEDEEGTLAMPHQWLEGNLPVSAKCVACDRTCGSVLRLQDWRCLWCRAMVHTSCKVSLPERCPLGSCRVSIVPPIALHSVAPDDAWEATRPVGCSPLLVFVNSKSGDNQGVRFLRRFKQLLNPAQVFDLLGGGPRLGLRLFRAFNPFRILVCGGDGSIGWVLSELDKLGAHQQCQLGVLPLGTGNDLARVLGWGSVCDADAHLPQLLEKYEKATTKMLDRWSVMVLEGNAQPAVSPAMTNDGELMSVYEDSVVAHLTKMLHSNQNTVILSSARVLCETVRDFVSKVGVAYSQQEPDSVDQNNTIANKCTVLNEKLDLLLKTLDEESMASCTTRKAIGDKSEKDAVNQETAAFRGRRPGTRQELAFIRREALVSRANSLKKAVRQIIEHAERAVDEQNAQTTHRSPPQLTFTMAGEQKCTAEPSKQDANRSSRLLVSMLPTIESVSGENSPCPSPQPLGIEDDDCRGRSPTSHSPTSSEAKDISKSPTASRRISSGSTLKNTALVASQISSLTTTTVQQREKSRSPELVASPLHRQLPIINPLVTLPSWPTEDLGSGIISKVLLANADALCAAASPLMDSTLNLEGFEEKCVMNNYFGIGLDAKITLDFHNKREEHPEKCRSRTKNMMWYGVLGGKELLQQTYKNLEQRVQLECDGQRIPLPSLQGIVILNIPSFAGGANFWGGTKEDDIFFAPSFDDKILEVVAVFGSVQMAASRLINLQHHRIAQCRVVTVTILGDEGVPVQVDGEAWIQLPGVLRIVHKNRAQMLYRNRHLESSLKTWQEKQRYMTGSFRASVLSGPLLSDEELQLLGPFLEAGVLFIRSIKIAAIDNQTIERELYQLAAQASSCMDKIFCGGTISEGPNLRSLATDVVNTLKLLHSETYSLLCEKFQEALPMEVEERLLSVLGIVGTELQKCSESGGFVYFHTCDDEHGGDKKKISRGLFKLKFKKQDKAKEPKQNVSSNSMKSELPLHQWGTEEVAVWLESIQLGEYKDNFVRNDVQGPELLHLERRDFKDLEVTKVGHIKRLQQAIKELAATHRQSSQWEKPMQ